MADPRLQDRPRTVNEQIADALILRGTYMERVKAQLVRDNVRHTQQELEKVLELVERRLSRIANRGNRVLDQKGFQDLMDSVVKQSTATYGALGAALASDMAELARIEASWMADEIGKHIPNLGISLEATTQETIRKIVRKRPFQGRTLREWIRKLDTDTQQQVRAAVRTGVIEGQSYRQIVRRLRGTRALGFADGVLPRSVQHVDTMTRTAVQHTVSQVREETYRENSDLVKQVQWVATLDLVTCPICASLDGQVWDLGHGPRPPAHPNCRCLHAPVLKSLNELGIPGGQIDPGTRASMSGEVPANVTFGEWLKTRSVREQNVVLGKTRGKLFRDGAFEGKKGPLDPSKILGANRRPLTIAALEKAGRA